jgi:hypothetical protein
MEKIIMEKRIMEKPVNLPEPPDFTGKINYGNNGHLQELWKKKGSDHFRDILNPYGETPNYGKIGRRRRLSKLNVFFSIILSVTINISKTYLIRTYQDLILIILFKFAVVLQHSRKREMLGLERS